MKRIQQIVNNKNYTNEKFLAGVVSLLLLFVFILPVMIYAAYNQAQSTQEQLCALTNVHYTGLVPCGNPCQPACDFSFFIKMINGIITWIISIATVIFTISAIWGGFLYMTSGVNEGNKTKARNILWNTLIGFVIILCAWLIVYTILVNLAPGNTSILKFIKK